MKTKSNIQFYSGKSRLLLRIVPALILAAALSALLLVSGCGSENASGGNSPAPSTDNSNTEGNGGSSQPGPGNTSNSGNGSGSGNASGPDESAGSGGNQDTGTGETGNEGSKDPGQSSEMSGKGTFQGLADSHSVELETTNGTEVFQFDEALAGKLNGIQEGTAVTFTYTSKNVDSGGGKTVQQLWLTGIEASGQ